MRGYFFVEFVTQDDDVFKAGREHFLGRVTAVPNLRLAEEIEPGAMDDARLFSGGLRAEEDRGSEDPFEGRHQSPILFAALRHAENLEHLRGRLEANGLTLLTYS